SARGGGYQKALIEEIEESYGRRDHEPRQEIEKDLSGIGEAAERILGPRHGGQMHALHGFAPERGHVRKIFNGERERRARSVRGELQARWSARRATSPDRGGC